MLMAVLLGACGGRGDVTPSERQRLELSPRVQSFLMEGQRAYHSGAFLAALALTDSVEKYAPDLADLHFLRGAIYTDLGRYDVADRAYERVLELDPTYSGAHMNKGINDVRRDALRDALVAFKAEEKISPHTNLYLEMGRTYARLGIADSARLAYERSLELDPENASAMMWLGQLYEELGDFDSALVYSRRGAALRPDNLDYKYLIGSQLFRTDSVEAAVSFLRPVADAQPWHHGAQYNMGQALMRLGQEDAARVYLDQAETAQQWQQEINEAGEAIDRDPDDVENWVRLAEAQRAVGRYDRAIEALQSAVAMDPRNLGLQTNLATLMLQSGDTESAVRRYEAIVNLDSTQSETWFNLGVAYGNSGRYGEARRAWERVLSLDPGHTRARQYLAQLGSLSGGG